MRRYRIMLLLVVLVSPVLSYGVDIEDNSSELILARKKDNFFSIEVSRLDHKVKAIDFSVESLTGNNTRLSDFHGKVVFLNFWATWCGPCKSEVKDIERLYDTLKDEDFTVMAVSIRENKKQIVSFMEKHDIDFPVYLDTNGDIATQYGVSGIPTTYIINPKGRIIAWAVGPRDWGSSESIELMRSLMN